MCNMLCRWVDPQVCKQYAIAASEAEAASQSGRKAANAYHGIALQLPSQDDAPLRFI